MSTYFKKISTQKGGNDSLICPSDITNENTDPFVKILSEIFNSSEPLTKIDIDMIINKNISKDAVPNKTYSFGLVDKFGENANYANKLGIDFLKSKISNSITSIDLLNFLESEEFKDKFNDTEESKDIKPIVEQIGGAKKTSKKLSKKPSKKTSKKSSKKTTKKTSKKTSKKMVGGTKSSKKTTKKTSKKSSKKTTKKTTKKTSKKSSKKTNKKNN